MSRQEHTVTFQR